MPSTPEQDLGSQEAREKRIEKKLTKLGANIVDTQVSALVNGGEEPIAEGAEETFKQTGVNMAKPLQSPTQITKKKR